MWLVGKCKSNVRIDLFKVMMKKKKRQTICSELLRKSGVGLKKMEFGVRKAVLESQLFPFFITFLW